MSRCWAAGAPSTKAWRGRGDCPRGLVLAQGRPSPRGRARRFLQLGAGGGAGSGPSTGAPVAGPVSFRGQNWAHAAGALGRTGLGLALKSEREKVSNGTDVRPLTPTPGVRNGAGGVGALLVVPGAQGWRLRGGRADTRSPPPGPCCPPGRAHRTHSQTSLLPYRSAFRSSRAPPPRLQKDKLQVFIPSNVHEGI